MACAFTGGINVSGQIPERRCRMANWHEQHLRLEGTAASHLDFVLQWTVTWFAKRPYHYLPWDLHLDTDGQNV